MDISLIKPYKKNQKKHPAKQIAKIANSIKEFGFVQPIVLDKTNEVIIGHGRLLAAQKLDLKDVPVVMADDLNEKQVKALRLADNKLNESDWDMSLVIDELKELDLTGFDIELTGFDKDLIIEPEDKDDHVPEVPEEPKSKLGELYELGEHRLLCGSATELADVEKLMGGQKADVVVTDPPYNTGMTEKGESKSSTRLSHMFNDSIENWDEFIEQFFASYITFSKAECAFYVFIDWRKVQDIRQEMEKHMDVKNVIVWDKGVHGLGSDYKYTYELCIVGKKGNPEIQNRYGKDFQDIWRVQRQVGRNEMHATAKPIELIEKPIKHASKQEDIVLDLFGGSGTTLIAAEKLNRKCYMTELDPKYIDVIRKRWAEYVHGEGCNWEELTPAIK